MLRLFLQQLRNDLDKVGGKDDKVRGLLNKMKKKKERKSCKLCE